MKLYELLDIMAETTLKRVTVYEWWNKPGKPSEYKYYADCKLGEDEETFYAKLTKVEDRLIQAVTVDKLGYTYICLKHER